MGICQNSYTEVSYFLVGNPIYILRCFGGIVRENFQQSWNSLGDFCRGGDIPWERFSIGNYHEEKFSFGKFSAEETLYLGRGDFWEIFSGQAGFPHDLKKDQKLNKNLSFFK